MQPVNVLAGALVAAVAPKMGIPVFGAMQLHKHVRTNLDTTPPNFWDTVTDGVEYGIGYWVGSWLMNSLFGAQ